MKVLKTMMIFFASIFLVSVSPGAQAACTAAQIGGTWRVFAVTGHVPAYEGTARGTLVFSATGALNTSSSSLVLSTGQTLRFSNGHGQVGSTCKTTGSLVMTNGKTMTLVDGQMNGSRNFVSAVYKQSDGDVGLVNFIK
jgi:hypothetical protein